MLQPGDDDLIARTDILPSPTLRNQVDGLGRARAKTISAEDDAFINLATVSRAFS
jgi:hypothetical protein